jgi:hypothetical protein
MRWDEIRMRQGRPLPAEERTHGARRQAALARQACVGLPYSGAAHTVHTLTLSHGEKGARDPGSGRDHKTRISKHISKTLAGP